MYPCKSDGCTTTAAKNRGHHAYLCPTHIADWAFAEGDGQPRESFEHLPMVVQRRLTARGIDPDQSLRSFLHSIRTGRGPLLTQVRRGS